MSVMIKRDTGLLGTMSKFQVIVNGEKVETINNSDVLELDIKEPEAIIQFSQFGVKTNEIQIKDGDSLELSTRSWSIYSIFALMILLNLVRPLAIRGIGYAIIVVYLLMALFKTGFIYEVKKVPMVSRY